MTQEAFDPKWRAAVADEELRRTFTDRDFADDGWELVPVPGHWRSVAAFAGTDGPLLYRTSFAATQPEGATRRWLLFDGLFYQGDVWLDGTYLGDTEGYFAPHAFEVTAALARVGEHHLAVEVACPHPTDRTAKRSLTGVFQHWDCLDPAWNPGGIWRPVRLEESGPVRITSLRTACREATVERAVLSFRAVMDSDTARVVTVRTEVGDADREAEHSLAAGENRIEWSFTCTAPTLWWPRALGDQAMYTVDVSVHTGEPSGALGPSDRRVFKTGLRQVTMRAWHVSVNGERLFLKGSNHGPTRMALAEATPEELRRDVELAVEAGLDLLRLHAHVTRPELYDAADELGLLLWQDMPLQWGYARSVRKQAVRQATQAVDLLGHHPSIAIWCGHNEPMAIDVDPGSLDDAGKMAGMAVRALAAQQLPTWNKTILDRSVKRALERADGTRPVVAHSGVLPHLPQLDGTDSHLYFGWYWGDERDFPRFCATVPRLARFVTEFGAQAVPAEASFMAPAGWPDLDWSHLGRRHALQKRFFDRYVPPAAHPTFESWQAATQAYQAELVKHHIETLRKLKYEPTGGFCQFCFADGMPAVTWAVLGHDRQPKAAYDALAAACQPVLVVAERPPAVVHPGDTLALDVHVVSDLRRDLGACVADASLSWEGGMRRWRWLGDVPADCCVRIGTIEMVVPDAAGELRLDLELSGPADATNSYVTRIESV